MLGALIRINVSLNFFHDHQVVDYYLCRCKLGLAYTAAGACGTESPFGNRPRAGTVMELSVKYIGKGSGSALG